MAEKTSTTTTYRSEKYNPHEIEPTWQRAWDESGIYQVDLTSDQPKYFFLTMYPYPSGDLHAGHWYAEAPADAAARFKRMSGYNVLFPMGYDAFGLPAENAAIKHGIHPAKWTYQNIERMTRQFKQMGAMFDWSKKVVTCDPEYYKWNQWFFVKMFERGLAYRKESYVNWDPVDKTVLANEQVIDGRGERSGALIERRLMPQWHFKITAYSEELLDFDKLDWPERVKLMQTNWIGRSEGAEVTFQSEEGDDIVVFTTRPDTLWGASFMVLAPEHPLVAKLTRSEQQEKVEAYVRRTSYLSEIDRQAENKEKTGEFIGAFAINPVNQAKIPIWIADYVMMGYGTGAIMAVPAHDERDFAFARQYGLEVIPVIQPPGEAFDGATTSEAYTGDGLMVHSDQFDGTPAGKEGDAEGIHQVIDWLEQQGIGKRRITYRLRDWLISRQRYWGTPIPMLYCDSCGVVAEKEENLPVVLPEDVEFLPTGESPLNHHQDFLVASCPRCGGQAKRETDTMDTFMDSSWYWFRYLSPHKSDGPVERDLVRRWAPVDTYTGGIEHAILHLLYARFFTKILRDLDLIDMDEPFLKLRNQGMILGEDNEKMSKRRGNVVNPDDLVASYGADTVRAYLMFIGPWEQGGPWNSKGIEGISRFLNRIWSLLVEPSTEPGEVDKNTLKKLRYATHSAIKEVSEDLEGFQFNTAIAELMSLTNIMMKIKGREVTEASEWREAERSLLLMLAPIVPHISEELWQRSGQRGSVHLEAWPDYDEEALVRDTIQMAVQINGKVRAQIRVPQDAGQETILQVAKSERNIARHLEGMTTVREIVVPGRLVNLVVKPNGA
jgi:leucyl-tRNA synthetase